MAPTNWDVCFNNPVSMPFSEMLPILTVISMSNKTTPTVLRGMSSSSMVPITLLRPPFAISAWSMEGTKGLTDGSGNLVSPLTRGTAGLQVTAGYFGPVDNVPFPADNPISVSFPMNAPANPANLIGKQV